MNGVTATATRNWRDSSPHHGSGHVARLNPRGPGRSSGRRVQRGVTTEEADYADRLRRSAGWAPKHRADA